MPDYRTLYNKTNLAKPILRFNILCFLCLLWLLPLLGVESVIHLETINQHTATILNVNYQNNFADLSSLYLEGWGMPLLDNEINFLVLGGAYKQAKLDVPDWKIPTLNCKFAKFNTYWVHHLLGNFYTINYQAFSWNGDKLRFNNSKETSYMQ